MNMLIVIPIVILLFGAFMIILASSAKARHAVGDYALGALSEEANRRAALIAPPSDDLLTSYPSDWVAEGENRALREWELRNPDLTLTTSGQIVPATKPLDIDRMKGVTLSAGEIVADRIILKPPKEVQEEITRLLTPMRVYPSLSDYDDEEPCTCIWCMDHSMID